MPASSVGQTLGRAFPGRHVPRAAERRGGQARGVAARDAVGAAPPVFLTTRIERNSALEVHKHTDLVEL